MDFSGKVALVTGSTSGIGLGIARTLAKKGCTVILTGLADQTTIDDLVNEFKILCNERASFLPCDMRSRDSVHQMYQEISKLYPDGVDILVNNAGINHVRPIEEFPDEKWDEMISIMLSSPFDLIKYFISGMKRKRWGRIINISSMMGLISQPGKAVYSAAKSGLIGLSRGVALEGAPFGVTCNAICPGYVYTAVTDPQVRAFQEKEGISTFEEAKDKFFSRAPTGKAVEVEQICDLVAFLCTSGANSMTGSPIVIDGGFTLQ
ncbi:D-beta-hydroxybutyrate dehydrogenase-like [Saccostrea echinata]|uniref:D-beta-hydroxybutyrate dehydrogenase-like n=1 Tax=Saccostrea echinata TaxID=191078 RepID=UPI002A804B14|nr:D-beta-hydroxybutyrate dehydrogenase-like [Saccostrea echinata]